MIIGIAGYGGSGKTLLAVSIVRHLQLHGYKVITNLLSYKYRDYDLITELPELMHEMVYNHSLVNEKRVALVDEIQNIIDSRESMHSANKQISRILFQLRKARIDMIYTLQDYYSVDVRLRRITERLLMPEYDEITHKMSITITDKNGIELGHTMLIINPAVYELYNTYEFLDIDSSIDFTNIFGENTKSKKYKRKAEPVE